MEKENMDLFVELDKWLVVRFLIKNKEMTASDIGHNRLIEQVLRLIRALVMFGYYSDGEHVKQLLGPLLVLLDGRGDKPFPQRSGIFKHKNAAVVYYRKEGRFKTGPGTRAIVNAKYR